MPKLIDLVGRRFGKLTVNARVAGFWKCFCDCGSVRLVATNNLKRTKSCGCAKIGRPPANKTHGMAGTPTYASWQAMIQRCTNPNCKSYSRWGGRGIGVCPRWMSFDSFLSDMGEKPTAAHTIDRINNDGQYCPENCRWATKVEQSNNRPGYNRLIAFRGSVMTIGEIASVVGMDYHKLYQRIKRYGWSVDRAVSAP